MTGDAAHDEKMEATGAESTTRPLSPETAQASKVRVVEQEVTTPTVDVDTLESRTPAHVSSMVEVKHAEVCQQVAVAVRSEAEDFNKQVAGLSQKQRRLNERTVQMQNGIDRNAAA